VCECLVNRMLCSYIITMYVYIFYLLSSTGTVGRLLITRVPGTTVPGIFFCARAPPAKIKFYKKRINHSLTQERRFVSVV
jgi:hypothetical protein